MLQREASFQELALARRITPRRDNYLPRLQEFDSKMLYHWPEAAHCRLAVETFISNALDAQSPVYEMAHNWISLVLKRNQHVPLLVAVCLYEAGLSEDSRKRVLTELCDRHDLPLSFFPEAEAIWRGLRDGKRVSWEEIVTRVGVPEWRAFPPNERPELCDACRRLTADPNPANLANLASDLAEDAHLENWPYLQECIVWVTCERPELLESLLTPRFSLFRRGIVSILTAKLPSFNLPGGFLEDKEKTRRYQEWLYSLAQLLAEKLPEISPDLRQEMVTRLAEVESHPWVWSIADRLLPYTSNQQAVYLLDKWFRALNASYRDQREPLWESESGSAWESAFWQVLEGSSPEITSGFLAELLTARDWWSWGSRRSPTLEEIGILMAKDPERYHNALQGPLSAGKGDTEFLLTYAEAVGPPRAKGVVESWLANFSPKPYIADEKAARLAKYVVEQGLSAGRFLSVSNFPNLLKAGYQLQSRDVASEESVWAILPQGDRGQYIPAPKIWGNRQWREILLRCGCAEEAVLESLLETVDSSKEALESRLAFLEEILISECQERPSLRQALCRLAWITRYHGAGGLARLLLVRENRLADWMDEDAQARMQSYIDRKWNWFLVEEPGVADGVLTVEEQRNLFFNKTSKEATTTSGYWGVSLPRPPSLARLFESQPARKRLAGWLVRHRNQINLHDMLKWIEFFDLIGYSRMKRVVYETLNDAWSDNVIRLAIKILENRKDQ